MLVGAWKRSEAVEGSRNERGEGPETGEGTEEGRTYWISKVRGQKTFLGAICDQFPTCYKLGILNFGTAVHAKPTGVCLRTFQLSAAPQEHMLWACQTGGVSPWQENGASFVSGESMRDWAFQGV